LPKRKRHVRARVLGDVSNHHSQKTHFSLPLLLSSNVQKKWPKFCVPHFGGAVQPPLAGAVWAFPRGPRAWTTEDSAQLGRQNGRRLRPGRTAASSRRTEAARDQPPRAPGSRRPPTEPVGQVSCVGALGGDRRTPRQPSHPFNLQCTDSYGAPTS
jgi:hypothetical protein